MNVVSIAASEWRVGAEQQDEIMDFYTSYVGPTISSSPDVLRIRLFEVDTATVLEGESYKTEEKEKLHTYFTLIELETEQWPWDVIFELAENEKWKKYFEKQSSVVSRDLRMHMNRANSQTEMAIEFLSCEQDVYQGRPGRCWY
jgi:hypothetical protein